MTADTAPDTGHGTPHYFLIDGSGYIFRAFFAFSGMNRSDGTPTNAVYGFSRMLLKLIGETGAHHCAVIFDRGRQSFRNDIYQDYKAHRPEAPPELVPQFDIIREAVKAFNLPCIEMEGYEADDLIATYATMARARGDRVTIVSSDKDLMQLVGPDIRMYDPARDREIGEAQVFEKFGVAPDRVIDVQALAGDSVDNVPGVPGIGPKIAAQLITDYGDLDTLLDRAGEIRQPKRRQNLIEHADMARISRQLVTLKTDVPVTDPLEALVRKEPDRKTVMDFLRAQDFRSLTETAFRNLLAGDGEPELLSEDTATDTGPEQVTYELVVDVAALERWIAEAERLGTVAVDTETDSLNASQARPGRPLDGHRTRSGLLYSPAARRRRY